MIPRLRIFAGPNGSGKSTVAAKILEQYPAVFVNADQIEIALKGSGYEIPFDASDTFDQFIKRSDLARDHGLGDLITLDVSQNKLIAKASINSYHAAAVAQYVRALLIEREKTLLLSRCLAILRN